MESKQFRIVILVLLCMSSLVLVAAVGNKKSDSSASQSPEGAKNGDQSKPLANTGKPELNDDGDL